ncbi:hypothetical protein DSO57_1022424 [Entomophthora muscae]|uniref:Uncharacterized protein n=1 Tax=Entomophthora muscae TaxID=34485 RepID=A0ACC2S598_9FUNG|nr:hypothetical protein DSO57_1022424 [Entomophthora muscae]
MKPLAISVAETKVSTSLSQSTKSSGKDFPDLTLEALAGLDPFTDYDIQADFAHLHSQLAASCAVTPVCPVASYSCTAHALVLVVPKLVYHVLALLLSLYYAYVQAHAQPAAYALAPEKPTAQPASQSFTHVDLSDFMDLPALLTKLIFKKANMKYWDEFDAKPCPVDALVFQEFDKADFMKDDEQVFNNSSPAFSHAEPPCAYFSVQGVCANMHNPANSSCYATGTFCQQPTSCSAPQAEVLFSLETFLMKKNAKLKKLVA